MIQSDSDQADPNAPESPTSGRPPEERVPPKTPDSDASSGQSEPPLGEKSPGAPFAVVALTYPVILILGLIAFALLLWFWRN
jgi:hypothetical protein